MVALKKKKVIKKKLKVATKKKIVVKKRVIKKKGKISFKRKRVVKKRVIKKKIIAFDLKRSKKNPIIEPKINKYWESKATFNPTAIYHDGKVHIIYRAIGDSDHSVLGYARSDNGLTISESSSAPVYFHFSSQNKSSSLSSISYSSGGGGGGGCEDPRLTLLGDKVYMLYTAFNGWESVRIALTSINLDDFISKRWNWKEPIFISPPGQVHKNWVIFPEKIRGKYAILHSVSPKIMINYFKSLDELDGTNFIHSIHQGSHLWAERDRLIRGVGPAPIKTKYGWLVLYHKMEKHDSHRYKLWAMILDEKDPTKVLYNSSQPILEPDEWYENEGYKSGVVYSCGAVVKDGQLFVYYGGADKVSCVTSADLNKFLKELIHSKVPKLSSKKNKK